MKASVDFRQYICYNVSVSCTVHAGRKYSEKKGHAPGAKLIRTAAVIPAVFDFTAAHGHTEKMNNIVITAAKPEDAAELLGIYSYYVENTAVTSEYETPSAEEFADRIRNVMKRYPYLVARIDGQIVGYVYVRPFHDRAAYAWSCETSIYVDRDFHHMGIGRALYLKIEEILRKQNIVNLYASVSYPEEETRFLTMDSCIFHSHLGFHQVGQFHHCRYKFGAWYNMTWMEKSISEPKADQPPFIPYPQLKND